MVPPQQAPTDLLSLLMRIDSAKMVASPQEDFALEKFTHLPGLLPFGMLSARPEMGLPGPGQPLPSFASL